MLQVSDEIESKASCEAPVGISQSNGTGLAEVKLPPKLTHDSRTSKKKRSEQRAREDTLISDIAQLRREKVTEREDKCRLQEELSKTRRELMDLRNKHRGELEALRSEINSLQANELRLQGTVQAAQRELVDVRLRHQDEVQSLRNEVESLQAETRSSGAEQIRVNELAQEQPRSGVDNSWEIGRDELDLNGPVLGVGGWGWVTKGTFRGCLVAIKQLHNAIFSEHNLGLFRREMEIAARLRHPCLVQFIGGAMDRTVPQGHALQPPLIVSELMETDLRRILPSSPSQEDLSRIGVDVALALNFLHLAKPDPIIHRDISSANILLYGSPGQWRGKLSDLGSAKIESHCLTEGPGAPIYSAPEATTPVKHSPKMDVFSFGVLLVEMYNRPWNMPAVGQHHSRASQLQSGLLRETVLQCLRQQPEDRPKVEAVLNILKSL